MMLSSHTCKPRRLATALLPLLLLAGAALAQSSDIQPVESIAAVVDDNVILRSDLERAIANIRAQYADRPNMLPPPAVLERQVLERLILQRLELDRATAAGITATDADIDNAMNSIAQQNRLSLPQLLERVAKDGLSPAEFRANLRDEIISQKLQQSFAQSRINVSEAEVDAALANAANTAVRQYHLAHILISIPDNASADQVQAAVQKAEGIKNQIERGTFTFAAAAVRYSNSPNALEGGDLGWRGANEIPPAFSTAIQQMQPGQVIGPIRGASGFQLLQLVDARDQVPAAGEKVTQYSAREILIRIDADTSDDAAKAKIDAIAAQLAGGGDFAKLARENSDDQTTRLRGGDLGWFTADSHGAALGMQVAALADGQTSAPFKTDEGWAIVQRSGSREIAAGNDALRGQIRETIGRRKMEEEWGRFLREMRSEAYVDIRDAQGHSTRPELPQTAPETPTRAPSTDPRLGDPTSRF
ncbi:peptidylprolyl isomerase [Thermomonas sp.]|uniref:peptidylprolyl isomerase n=1 Tax=Thermomonas sp. TaxID=1971895 RepID=UPI002C8BBD60|nr:peptidylprolyl isomerase [Thermomonas sp.]HRO63063.1 peptidylprolyl isomerase [Thermomonas sp.]